MSTNWRDEAKALEQRLMVVQDQYAELARVRLASQRLLG
jgi:hypothetical protein